MKTHKTLKKNHPNISMAGCDFSTKICSNQKIIAQFKKNPSCLFLLIYSSNSLPPAGGGSVL